jgi:hypothetical protein
MTGAILALHHFSFGAIRLDTNRAVRGNRCSLHLNLLFEWFVVYLYFMEASTSILSDHFELKRGG